MTNVTCELFIDDIFTFCMIDSSFNRIESITLDDISSHGFMKYFIHLRSLPHLYSLAINLNGEKNPNPTNIYQLIFSLSHLKYNQLQTFSHERLNHFVPFINNDQFSNIEYLFMNHSCTLGELTSILSQSRRLRHLVCYNLVQDNFNFKIEQSLILSDLIRIRIGRCHVNFNIFEMFIRKILSPLRVLSIKQCRTNDYLDVDRWEKLIIEYIPLLHKFHFEYFKKFDRYHQGIHLHTNLNWFTSKFWVERQWFSELVIHKNGIIYSIHSHTNPWDGIYKHREIASYFDQNLTQYITINNRQDATNVSSTQFIPIIQLTVKAHPTDHRNRTLIPDLELILRAVPFTGLTINCKDIPIEILVKIINFLPNLNLLKVSSLLSIELNQTFHQDENLRSLTLNNNKITKVNFEKMIDIEQIHMILKLCTGMQYFQIHVTKYIDVKILIRFILTNISTYVPLLNSLCLYIPNANENTVEELQKLIDSEKLLTNYMIKRIGNYILLKWN